jgi:hypothetical protein
LLRWRQDSRYFLPPDEAGLAAIAKDQRRFF